MTTILDGKNLRDKILTDLKTRITKFEQKPALVVILIGENIWQNDISLPK